jgi:CheY-like chemotaxis protein
VIEKPVRAALPEIEGQGFFELLDNVYATGTPFVGRSVPVRMSTADMLSDLGYKVVEAASAEEALRLLNGGLRADLIVTDHLMPGMNGTDLARSVRLQRPNIQVLLISGYSETEGIAPDLPRLSKPFRNADLAASLAALRQGNRSFAE